VDISLSLPSERVSTISRAVHPKDTFAYLHQLTWLRVVRWLRRKHRRANWGWLRRRYLANAWWPEHDGEALFDCRAVPATRYRYRGTKIPSPWVGTTEEAE
jgi:RNA-directed DNA polymerase